MTQDAKPITLIKANKLFDFPGAESVKVQVSNKDLITHRDGEIIYQINDAAEHIYLILDGAVKIKFSIAIEGQRIFERGTGEFFGEKEFLEKTSRASSAVAIRPTRLFVMRRKELNDLISANRAMLNTLQGIDVSPDEYSGFRTTRENVPDEISKLLHSSTEQEFDPFGYRPSGTGVTMTHEERPAPAMPEAPAQLESPAGESLPSRLKSTFEDTFTFQKDVVEPIPPSDAEEAAPSGFSWDFSSVGEADSAPVIGSEPSDQPAGGFRFHLPEEEEPAAAPEETQGFNFSAFAEQPFTAQSDAPIPEPSVPVEQKVPEQTIPQWNDEQFGDEPIREFEFDENGNLIPVTGGPAAEDSLDVPEDFFNKFKTGITEPPAKPAAPDRDKLFEAELTGKDLSLPKDMAEQEPQFGQSGFQFTAPLEVKAGHEQQAQKPIAAAKQAVELTKDQLQKIVDAARLVNSNIKIDEVLNSIVQAGSQITGADRGTLYIVDQQAQELWSKIIRGENIEEIRLKFGQGLAGWVAKTGETVNIKDVHKDERFNANIDKMTGYRTKSMLCFPIKNKDGVIAAVIQLLNSKRGAFNDIDEMYLDALSSHIALALSNAEMVEQLLRTDRLASLGKMAKFIIADIKKPILSIKQLTDHIRRKDVSPEINQVLGLILEQSNMVIDLVLTTLSYSEGKSVLNRKVLNVHRVMDELLDMLAEYVESRKTKLYKKFSADVLISVDRRELYQAFFQITKNACDSMPQGGELYVTAQVANSGKNVEISFRDSGTGMPDSVREKIFEPFYVYSKPHGVGLGLPISQKIIRDHDGEIRVDSLLGQGTTAVISLPVVTEF